MAGYIPKFRTTICAIPKKSAWLEFSALILQTHTVISSPKILRVFFLECHEIRYFTQPRYQQLSNIVHELSTILQTDTLAY